VSNDNWFLNDVYLSGQLPSMTEKPTLCVEPAKQFLDSKNNIRTTSGFTDTCNRIKETNLKYQGREE